MRKRAKRQGHHAPSVTNYLVLLMAKGMCEVAKESSKRIKGNAEGRALEKRYRNGRKTQGGSRRGEGEVGDL